MSQAGDTHTEADHEAYNAFYRALYDHIRDPRVVADRITADMTGGMGGQLSEDIAADLGFELTVETAYDVALAYPTSDAFPDPERLERTFHYTSTRDIWNDFKAELEEDGWVFRGEYGIPPSEQTTNTDNFEEFDTDVNWGDDW